MRRRCLLLLLALTLTFPTSSWAAIATDAFTDGSHSTGTSHTYAHTVGVGSDRILFVAAMTPTDVVTGITYNSIAMSLVAKVQRSGAGNWIYLYVLVAPASGNNNVVVSASASVLIDSAAGSYTGAAQTGQPDSSNTGTAASATSITVSTTVVGTGCWLVGWFHGGSVPGAGTGTTSRVANANSIMLADSNGTVGSGSQSLQATEGFATAWGGVVASFAPVGGGGGGVTPRGMLLGVGP